MSGLAVELYIIKQVCVFIFQKRLSTVSLLFLTVATKKQSKAKTMFLRRKRKSCICVPFLGVYFISAAAAAAIGVLQLQLLSTVNGFQPPVISSHSASAQRHRQWQRQWTSDKQQLLPADLLVKASPSNNESDRGNDKKKKKKTTTTGVYVRPSAAVERGSGFFFPGLEGPKVRLVAGSVLLAVTGINHVVSASSSLFSEALAVFYSLLVLLQGAIETSKEGRIETIVGAAQSRSRSQQIKMQMEENEESSSSTNSRQFSQQWSASRFHTKNSSWKQRVEWAATSYLTLTPATHMILLRNEQQETSSSSPIIDYWLGVTGIQQQEEEDKENNATTMESATTAALQTIQQSKGGRVALPVDHPAAALIPEKEYRRCIILQRISSDTCWMVASNDLLASFTKQDLQWLGQLARYIANDDDDDDDDNDDEGA